MDGDERLCRVIYVPNMLQCWIREEKAFTSCIGASSIKPPLHEWLSLRDEVSSRDEKRVSAVVVNVLAIAHHAEARHLKRSVSNRARSPARTNTIRV